MINFIIPIKQMYVVIPVNRFSAYLEGRNYWKVMVYSKVWSTVLHNIWF